MKRPIPHYSHRIPLVGKEGSQYKPDFILAICKGVVRLAALNELELDGVIRIVEDYLEELKDIRWRRNRISKAMSR